MKNLVYSVTLLLLSIFFSCGSDDDIELEVNEYAAFLADRTPQFIGELNGEEFSWRKDEVYADNYYYSNDDDIIRNVGYSLFENYNSNRNMVYINTPTYNTASDIEFENVFDLGRKNLGIDNETFYLSFRVNYDDYQICHQLGDNQGNELEILQWEEVNDLSVSSTVYLNVWFKINDMILIDYCPNNNDVVLTNGFLMARFIKFRAE